MENKGQIALFVLIAAVIVASAAFIFLIKPEKEVVTPEIMPIQSHVQGCVEESSKYALYMIGLQGGYFKLPELSVEDVAVYFNKNKNTAPRLSTIEQELAAYVNARLPLCTNFSKFPDFSIEAGKVTSEAKVLNGIVKFNVNWPLTIKKGTTTQQLKKFNANIPSRLLAVYNLSIEMTSDQLDNPELICWSCFANDAVANGLYIEVPRLGDVTIFKIIDKNVTLLDLPYEYSFAFAY